MTPFFLFLLTYKYLCIGYTANEGATVYVISLIVKNEFGVMQRVMGEFTRNKINVETIVVGKCERPGKSRIVLSVVDRAVAEMAIGRLQKLQDVYDTELVPNY